MGLPDKAKPSSDSDLEYVKRCLIQQNLGGYLVEAKETGQKRQDERDNLVAIKRNHRICEGYKVLIKELYRYATEGIISIHDQIESVSLKECLQQGKRLEFLSDPGKLKNHLETGGSVQGSHHYTISVLLTFYEMAKNLALDRKQTEAIHVFTFLTEIKPHIPSFWIGLGLA